MNTENSGNLQKTIAVIIIAAIALFFILATVVQGFGTTDAPIPDSESQKDPPSGDGSNTPSDNESNQPEDDGSDTEQTSRPDEIKYKSYLTGLEISDESHPYQRLVYICDAESNLYGAVGAEIIIEIPCNSGQTRYAVYVPCNENLGKIGAVAPTKSYISDTCSLFGGIICAFGADDSVDYAPNDPTIHLDLSLEQSYYYRENISSVYTRSDLINQFIKEEKLKLLMENTPTAPFVFSDEAVLGKASAKSILIPYSSDNTTAFIYDEETGRYSFIKNSKKQYDMLGGDELGFDNLFVLFSDSITYEMSDGAETVMQTDSTGMGYYINKGKLTEFKWECDDSGELRFLSLNGEQLAINPGNSYIAYYKSSCINAVTFE